jgi:pimeloyl-ACP methyl ester carboxylesterase
LHFTKDDFVKVPVTIARFHLEDAFPPRKYIERGYNVQRWTDMPAGGHFASMEQPELLAEDIKAFFQLLLAN